MASVLVVFESKYGQSSKIADYVSDLARRRGHAVRVGRADPSLALEIDASDLVVIVAPIYRGRHEERIAGFVQQNAAVLSRRPSVLLSVSGSAASADPVVRRSAESIAHAFVADAHWTATAVLAVGGAMAYPRYGLLLRLLTKLVSWRRGGPTDTSRVHEFTDWAALENGLGPILGALEAPAAAFHPAPLPKTCVDPHPLRARGIETTGLA